MTALKDATRVKFNLAGARRVYAGPSLAWQFKGYLNPTLGNVSTPDTPDMAVADGTVRLAVRARIDTLGSGFPTLLYKSGADGVTQREFMMYTYPSASQLAGSTTNLAATATTDVTILQPVTPLGTDRTYGFEMTRGGTAGAVIVDGVRTAKASNAPQGLPDRPESVRVGPIAGALFDGRIYWAQLEAINRARLVFPGVAGNYASVPDATTLRVTGDIDIVARIAPATWTPAANQVIVAKWGPLGTSYMLRLQTSGGLLLNISTTGSDNLSVGSSVPITAANGAALWVRCTRVAATGLLRFYTAPDAAVEPTTWTQLGTDRTIATGNIWSGTAPVELNSFSSGTAGWFAGRIARTIVRNGIAGTTVLDVNENDGYNLTGSTFPATSGQTVTVAQTAGNTIVQPQADRVVWRFDANDYPGTGTTYVDPRGRTWTLSAAGAIAGP
jgi:hypothetical protein